MAWTFNPFTGKLDQTGISGILPIASGGTNSGTALSGSSIIISDGSKIVQGAAGTTSTLLHGNAAGAPTYGAVALGTEVSGTLSATNGGTGADTHLSTGMAKVSSGTWSVTALTSTRVPFADANGLLVDDSDLTFSVDTLTATKLLAPTSVSTPSLISTGAVGITPASGSNLNVTLATTGDLAVNTNQLYVDTSAARVGVGTATPSVTLDIHGDLAVTATNKIYVDGGGDTYFTEGVANQIYVYTAGINTLIIQNGQITSKGAGGTGSVLLGDAATANGSSSVSFIGSNTVNNWQIRQNNVTSGDLTFMISTAAGGGTFTGTPVLQLTVDNNMGLRGAAVRGTTAGAGVLNLFNNTAPAGTLTNGISHYSSSGEAFVMNSSGVATKLTDDIYTVDWTDISGTSTIVGWSSFTLKMLAVKKIGKTVHVWFELGGTSNSTTTSFTVPYANKTSTNNDVYFMIRVVNNGTVSTTVGMGTLPSGSSTVDLRMDQTGTTWTASGTKTVQGQFTYQTA